MSSRHNSIQTRAMLAALHISKWGATRTDKKVTEDVASRNRISSKRAGYYRKHAIDPETPSLTAVTNAVTSLRRRHYYWTLPWGEDGARILPAANFDKYSADMRLLRAEFDRCAADFIAEYPTLAQRAKSELGALFDPSDYPSDIASKFNVEVSIMPLPDAQDFRVDLPEDAIDEIRSNITRELEKTTGDAMRDVYSRLFDQVHKIVTSFADPKGKINSITINNLKELLDLIPSLNFVDDQMIEQFRKRAEALIVDADVIREMPERRRDIAEQAAQIESDMAAFMGVAKT